MEVPRAEAQRWAVRLHALLEPEARRKAAARELRRRPAAEATQLIHHMLRLAQEGFEPAPCVLQAIVAALDEEASSLPSAWALRQLAAAQSLEDVEALFVEGEAKKELELGAAARSDARLFSMSLGHLKTRARTSRDPDELAKLAAMSDASVMRNLLQNPRLTEAVVVRIAARRPARPEPLVEIWRQTRWSVRHAVRRALVFNPYLPPEVGAKIVPLLRTPDLRELANDGAVHEGLRDLARKLLAGLEASPRS